MRRFEAKSNHPMFGKSHTSNARLLISKPGSLNPMFGEKRFQTTKQNISDKLSKHPGG